MPWQYVVLPDPGGPITNCGQTSEFSENHQFAMKLHESVPPVAVREALFRDSYLSERHCFVLRALKIK
jgi:hypothetical protein